MWNDVLERVVAANRGMLRKLIQVARCMAEGGRIMYHFSRQLFSRMGMAFRFITPGAIAFTALRLL
jgi:hypothetical protein